MIVVFSNAGTHEVRRMEFWPSGVMLVFYDREPFLVQLDEADLAKFVTLHNAGGVRTLKINVAEVRTVH